MPDKSSSGTTLLVLLELDFGVDLAVVDIVAVESATFGFGSFFFVFFDMVLGSCNKREARTK